MTLSGSVAGIAMYKEITPLLTNPADTFFDPTTQAAYWYDGTNFYTGDSPQSIQAKANYLHCDGYAGAMMFSLYDLDPAATLFNDVVTDVNGSASTCTGQPTPPPTTAPPTTAPPTTAPPTTPPPTTPATRRLHGTGLDRDRDLHRRPDSLRKRPPIHRKMVDPRRRPSHPPRHRRRLDRQRHLHRRRHHTTTDQRPTHHRTTNHDTADHTTTHRHPTLGRQPRLHRRHPRHLRRPHLQMPAITHLTGRLGTTERTGPLATRELIRTTA